jgi:predicted O-linked N-acetylglucosamine transferase (SPINDLY family)
MVARSDEDYFELAYNYAINPELQRQTLEWLSKAKDSSALFSTVDYTRDLERLLETAHAKWLRGDGPADIH